MIATADFETINNPDDCRVWAYGICEIGKPDNFIYGNNLDEFMLVHCADKKVNHTFYFHNLAFDGEFIFYWLFWNGFEHVENRKEFRDKTFTTLISDKGQFYSMEICFEKKGKKTNKVTLYDSLKILNFSVDKIAKDFGLPISKLEIDYNEYRPVGHKLTETEVNYLRNDVEIMSRALHIMFEQNMNKMTIASSALAEYKEVFSEKRFITAFPKLSCDAFIRKSYKGGWTYLAKKYKGKTIGDGIVLDVNSLYPWVMREKELPYGYPMHYDGEYEKDELYPLYVQRFTCNFRIKPDHVPTIQIKGSLKFIENEYLESSVNAFGEDEEIMLTLTSVDLDLFLDHYEVFNITWLEGYKFKSSSELFKDYIDKWVKVKIQSSKDNNPSMRAIAKLMLNSLYGKFALNPIVRGKVPVYNKTKELIQFKYTEEEYRDPLYIPVGTFITAYAREKTIRSAQSVFNRFAYADTDSLHLEGLEVPIELGIDPYNLGYWDNEFVFSKGKYIRQKCYMEHGKNPKDEEEEYTKITCAGMPSRCYEYVDFDNFEVGSKFKGKLQKKRVTGGISLQEGEFTIKKSSL